MPNWNDMLDEVNRLGNQFDIIRRKYLHKLHLKTERNIIAYYSGWLQKSDLVQHNPSAFTVTDEDKTGFMSAINGLDKTIGLDLLLHTPGGSIATTESLVEYLRSIFGTNIRVIVPQSAMSAGSMIACSSKEIIMGKHSNLGPIDPQFNGLPAHGIIEEFYRARNEIIENPSTIPVWQPIIAKYNPTIIGECEKAIAWSNQMVHQWLVTGMFADNPDKQNIAAAIVEELGSHALTLAHDRHISINKAKEIGLNVVSLEDDPELQEAVLSVHHSLMLTFSSTQTTKIIENHKGVAFVTQAQSIPFFSQHGFPQPFHVNNETPAES